MEYLFNTRPDKSLKQLLKTVIKKTFLFFAVLPAFSYINAQSSLKSSAADDANTNEITRSYIPPARILWQMGNIINSGRLLMPGIGQADLSNRDLCVMKSDSISSPCILLDYGKELQGGIRIVTGMWAGNKPVKVRLRFGESAGEAMSEIGIDGSTNDHAMRDFIAELPWLGRLDIGNTGFRFVRIDLVEKNAELWLKEVPAIFSFRDIPYLGSFRSSDTLLNKIWETGAYTVHLNMQEYLWDGIKRDRLVWVGDMHPETSTISAVFGYNEVVPKSLDLARDLTPLPEWMNGISAYSMWWIIIQRDWYLHTGDMEYLKEQQLYLQGLLKLLISKIDSDNKEVLDGQRFLDWPSSENPQGIHAGLQAMMIISLDAGAELCGYLQDEITAKECSKAIYRLKKYIPKTNNSKQAAALLALSGLISAQDANDSVLSTGGARNYSTFYGYYMLEAMAKAGDYQGAINIIREYWGAMLKLGATTFWEDFNMEWLPSAARIDELPKTGEKDIHASYGDYCYKGYRHSLCHGWASGPTPWLTGHVLGIKVITPGCRKIKIEPHLGDLSFAEGTFPTPYGIITVKHMRMENGEIKTAVTSPEEVEIIK